MIGGVSKVVDFGGGVFGGCGGFVYGLMSLGG